MTIGGEDRIGLIQRNVEWRKLYVLVCTHPGLSYSTERDIRNGSV